MQTPQCHLHFLFEYSGGFAIRSWSFAILYVSDNVADIFKNWSKGQDSPSWQVICDLVLAMEGVLL